MPDTLAEGLFAILFLLFGIVLPLVLRARGAAQRARHAGAWGLVPRLPQVREEPEEEPVTAAAAAPIPAPPRPAVTLPPEPPTIAPPRMPTPAAPLAAPGGLGRLRRLTPWQRAVVWAEILGPPRGLQ